MIYLKKKLLVTILLFTWITVSNCKFYSSVHFSRYSRGFKNQLSDQSTSNESLYTTEDLIKRLPKTVEPISYELEIFPCFSSFLTFIGKTIIQMKILNDTNTITLHSHQLEIRDITLLDYKVVGTVYDDTNQQLTIQFDKLLKTDQIIDLTFEYAGLINDLETKGLYKKNYIENDTSRWIVSTNFQPIYARQVFPCFDEPAFKATFKINIAVPKTYTTLSNMGSHFKKEFNPISGREWHKYEKSVKMSTYLIAFAIVDLQKVQQPGSSVSVWHRRDLNSNYEFASKFGDAALKFLENLLQYKRVLNDMNYILVPNFIIDGMENWGLISFREEVLTYNITEIHRKEKMLNILLISHESVHMWFGNLVTLDWWNSVWLNEGLTEYISYIISDKIEPKWEYLKMFVPNALHLAFDADSTESSHSMNDKVQNSLGINLFDTIAYQKSASVLRMFHQCFGDTAFYSILQTYIKRYAFKNAVADQFTAEFERYFETSNLTIPGNPEVNVTTIINSWTNQAGYPVVTAIRQENTITFQQNRFFMSSVSNEYLQNMKYWIPITYTTETENNFKNVKPHFWLGEIEKPISIDSNSTWFIVNLEQVGYYRVNYDENNWRALIDVLDSDKFTVISEINRAQLIDDSFKLAQAGKLSYDIALNVTKYLYKETSFYPWNAFFGAVNHLSKPIENRPEIHDLYQKYILSLLSPIYKKFEFKLDTSNDTHSNVLIRELILETACYFGDTDCMRQSVKDNFNQNPLISNFDDLISCDILKMESNEKVFKYLTENRYSKCSKDPEVFKFYLQEYLNPYSNISNKENFLNLIYATNQTNLEVVLQYLENNITYLYQQYRTWDYVGYMYQNIAQYISSEVQIEYLKRLMNDTNMINIKSHLQQAIDIAETNFKWFEEISNQIYKWLENYNKKRGGNFNAFNNIRKDHTRY